MRLGGILHPLLMGKPVEAVRAQWMVFWNPWVLKVLVRVAHANALHDSARLEIVKCGERNDLGERQTLETNPKGRLRVECNLKLTPLKKQFPSKFDPC